MVLVKKGSITPHTQFEGEVYVLKKEEGGRHTPFFAGYRPQFYIRTTDVTAQITEFRNVTFAPKRFKTRPRRSKTPSRRSKMSPRRSKTRPRRPKPPRRDFRWFLEPKWSQVEPSWYKIRMRKWSYIKIAWKQQILFFPYHLIIVHNSEIDFRRQKCAQIRSKLHLRWHG